MWGQPSAAIANPYDSAKASIQSSGLENQRATRDRQRRASRSIAEREADRAAQRANQTNQQRAEHATGQASTRAQQPTTCRCAKSFQAGDSMQRHDLGRMEQQWELQEQQRAMQADPWASIQVVKFVGEIQRLHSKGQGQTVPEATIVLLRLHVFPDHVQGYKPLTDKPTDIILKGSNEFGSRAGFVVLLRGPEQYLPKGPGYIYIYHTKEAAYEYKVGVCKDLPERRVDSGKLVGRVVNQRKRNHKEYLLAESFKVPHRTLVDEVLKIRLKSWNFTILVGDGYTEWFRNILIGSLKDHVSDTINVVTSLYPEYWHMQWDNLFQRGSRFGQLCLKACSSDMY